MNNLSRSCSHCQVQVEFLGSHVPTRRLWDAQKLRLEFTVGAGDLASVGCVVPPVGALARLPTFNVGQDGGVLEAWVDTLIREDHSVATVVHVLAVVA